MTTSRGAGREAALRRAVVEVGHRMWLRGMVAANDGNVSVRLDAERVLCTPTGVSKGALREDLLAIVSLDGEVLDAGTGRGPSSETPMHLRVYRVDPGVGAVVHAHPPHATAFAVRGDAVATDLLAESVITLPELPLAPYATPSTAGVADSVEPFVLSHRACLLEHHGALSWGAELEEAYLTMERIEYLAQVTMLTRALGGPRPLGEERLGELRRHFGLPGG